MIIDWIVALLLLILLLLPMQKKEKPEPRSISVQESSVIKGILSIMVFYNHFTGYFSEKGSVFYVLNHTGHLMVSAFLFLSGYGLFVAYSNKKTGVRFLFNRYVKVLVPYWFCLIISAISNYLFNVPNKEIVNTKTILLSVLPIKEVVENSWFVAAILVLYIVFVFSRNVFKTMDLTVKMIAVMIVFVFLVVPYRFWALTFFAFPLGIFIAQYEEKILSVFRRNSILLFIGLMVAIVLFGGLKILAERFDKEYMGYISDCSSGLLFSIWLYTALMIVRVGNPITSFLGKISYEIYLIHGLSIHVAQMLVGKENSLAFQFCAFGCTLLLAYLIHLASRPLLFVLTKKLSIIPNKAAV